MTALPTLRLKIDSVAFGGKGVARHEGKVYFVQDAVEGDVVQAQVISDSGRYADAGIVSFESKSEARGPSPCPYSDSCGGCQWMGIHYEKQLEWKKQFVSTALARIGRLSADEMNPTMLGSPTLLGYRNRILLRGLIHPEGHLEVGYFRRGSRELVTIDRCAIAADGINQFVASLRGLSLPAPAERRFRIEIQELPLQKAEGNAYLVATVYPAAMPCDDLKPLVAAIQDIPDVRWAGFVFALPGSPTLPFDNDQGLTHLTRPGQFQQVNIAHNHTLRALVFDFATRAAPRRVLDLFCGGGNLSLQLADGVRYVEGIEFDKRAIDTARQNAELNGLKNTLYLSGDAEKHLWKCAKQGELFDLIIADPPREGMFKALIPLMKIGPSDIIYVSCDPTTLARDIGSLIRADYKIEQLLALDFFPNTYHVETVVWLRRRRE